MLFLPPHRKLCCAASPVIVAAFRRGPGNDRRGARAPLPSLHAFNYSMHTAFAELGDEFLTGFEFGSFADDLS